jgi:hypothetical protein
LDYLGNDFLCQFSIVLKCCKNKVTAQNRTIPRSHKQFVAPDWSAL